MKIEKIRAGNGADPNNNKIKTRWTKLRRNPQNNDVRFAEIMIMLSTAFAAVVSGTN